MYVKHTVKSTVNKQELFYEWSLLVDYYAQFTADIAFNNNC
jgi:hypothetical protein